ncbi:hypothetical protein TREMEDRAFT_67753 [Tremella mesenterica DSM 1558]|uniref:uncharacterized protein n=1 Tax=Tremella mesenterica (strain ATCC 24925 / CBS 8224 / DSM 1558 / NBRC 9311 / NRRL Y-6157 / RJB 2259-6 / UBC 559-6) TaxID=578456 RepID=UPI0003F49C26|nr:uncharacterized protein TREMEDRAFT_67753 [Tremella mesenterica DSM 1558]EIW71416.1 hypothetical protein TREMEDRAFT_67753 [Tremella mesenterica DSM 1558]
MYLQTGPEVVVEQDTQESGATSTHLLKRVLSHGSNGSAPTASTVTPPGNVNRPLSPSSGGARTPKARKSILKPENGEQLASDLDQLKVRSPAFNSQQLPPQSLSQVLTPVSQPRSHKNVRQYSSSTDSSSSINPPSHLGSMYGPEGFPIHSGSSENVTDPTKQLGMRMSAEAIAAVAAADEAIKKLNGTPTLYQGPGYPGSMYQTPLAGPYPIGDNAYQLPRNLAGFIKPAGYSGKNHQARSPIDHTVTRQSSTSSTEASSTSSEESDLCIPVVEWVPRPIIGSPGPGHSPWGAPLSQITPKSPQRSGPSMGPPSSTTRRASGATNGSSSHAPPFDHRQSLPVGATAHTPGGLSQSSVLPLGHHPDAPVEEEDDDATVGHREHSPSTSSQSARSGLDLLWRAASGDIPAKSPSPYDLPGDHKGKRKAGAEAVAQWRKSGIPTGPTRNGQRIQTSPPTKKRRKSEIQMEHIDPVLRDREDTPLDAGGLEEHGSWGYGSESSGISEGDSEYKGETGGKTTRTPAPKARGGRRVVTTTTGRGRTNVGSTSAGASKTAPRKSRVSNESPSGGKRRFSGGGGGGGVQCEYVNPLPPYNRCQDIFTRKYDLPRHMARHGRREGELVMEGKLSEEKAVLWRSMKDKPKVMCHVCDESFTRMDALKRHQAKQHH